MCERENEEVIFMDDGTIAEDELIHGEEDEK